MTRQVPVTPTNGPKPAGKPTECFYCQRALGEFHADDCVCIRKKIRVKFSITRNVIVPNDWTDEQVEFWLNEGSSCMDNHVQRLAAMYDRVQDRRRCTCGIVIGEVVKTV